MEVVCSNRSSEGFKFRPQRVELQRLGAAILGLPDRERLVITLYCYEGLATQEIAQLLAKPESIISELHVSTVARPHSSTVQAEILDQRSVS